MKETTIDGNKITVRVSIDAVNGTYEPHVVSFIMFMSDGYYKNQLTGKNYGQIKGLINRLANIQHDHGSFLDELDDNVITQIDISVIDTFTTATFTFEPKVIIPEPPIIAKPVTNAISGLEIDE